MRDQAGPLPAQPYILVLWATHIGRYAIKHSPSENARASEPSRAIVKVLGTLCERSPLSPYPAVCTGTASATLLSLTAALRSALVPRRLFSSFSFHVALLSLFLPARSSPLCLPLRVYGAAPRFSHPAHPKPIANVYTWERERDEEKLRSKATSKTETVAPRPNSRPPNPRSPFSERLALATAGGRWRSRRQKRDRIRRKWWCSLLWPVLLVASFRLASHHRQAEPTRTEIPRLLFRSFDTEQDDAGPRRCARMKTTDREEKIMCRHDLPRCSSSDVRQRGRVSAFSAGWTRTRRKGMPRRGTRTRCRECSVCICPRRVDVVVVDMGAALDRKRRVTDWNGKGEAVEEEIFEKWPEKGITLDRESRSRERRRVKSASLSIVCTEARRVQKETIATKDKEKMFLRWRCFLSLCGGALRYSFSNTCN